MGPRPCASSGGTSTRWDLDRRDLDPVPRRPPGILPPRDGCRVGDTVPGRRMLTQAQAQAQAQAQSTHTDGERPHRRGVAPNRYVTVHPASFLRGEHAGSATPYRVGAQPEHAQAPAQRTHARAHEKALTPTFHDTTRRSARRTGTSPSTRHPSSEGRMPGRRHRTESAHGPNRHRHRHRHTQAQGGALAPAAPRRSRHAPNRYLTVHPASFLRGQDAGSAAPYRVGTQAPIRGALMPAAA